MTSGICAGTCGKQLRDRPDKSGRSRKLYKDGRCQTCWRLWQAEIAMNAYGHRPARPKDAFPLCAGGCGSRIITDRADARAGCRLNAGGGMCASCLNAEIVNPRPELTEQEIRVLALIDHEAAAPDRKTIAEALGLTINTGTDAA